MELLKLYWSFMLIGFSSFGGLSMIPQISREVVSHGWMTAAQVTDIVAIAEVTPGPLGLNCATFAGMQAAGPLGAFAANLGALTPSLTVAAVAAIFLDRFKSSRLMQRILLGVRPACLGMIVGLLITMLQTNYVGPAGVKYSSCAISAVDMFLLLKWKWSVPKAILFSAAMGIVVFGVLPLGI